MGQAALDAISELPSLISDGEDTAPGEPSQAQEATYLVQVARDAMACQFQVFLNAGQHTGAVEAALEALDRVESIEDQLTVYRSHSEVMRLNSAAAQRPVAAEAGLFELLRIAVQLSEDTQGAFDITAGSLAKAWGFFRREGRPPTSEALAATLQNVGSQWLELDAEKKTVHFQRPGLEINLGAIGKGYALDRAADVLRSAGVTDFLIHGGQSSILATGSRLAVDSRGWRVALRHPLRQQQRLAEIWLQDRGLGTSGSGNQFFHFAGKRYGHVIDPRTGCPADGILSATVLAPTATLADALATAFFVMGVEPTLQFCEARPELGVVLVCPGDDAATVKLIAHGIRDDQWMPLSS